MLSGYKGCRVRENNNDTNTEVSNSNSNAEFRGFTNATQGNGNFAPQFSAAGAAGGAATGFNLLNFFIGGILVNGNIAGDASAVSHNENSPELVNRG